MRRWSFLTAVLILLIIITGCPSTPEIQSGILSISLGNTAEMPSDTGVKVKLSDGTEHLLLKEGSPINITLPIGAYAVSYEIVGDINGTISTNPSDLSSVVIQNGQVTDIKFNYEKNKPVEPEPETGVVRFSVVDNDGLLSSEQTINIKLGSQTYSLNKGTTEFKLPVGSYAVSVFNEPDNLVYTLSTNQIELTKDGYIGSITVKKATGTLIVSLIGTDPKAEVSVMANSNEVGLVSYSKELRTELEVGTYTLSSAQVDGFSFSFSQSNVQISKGKEVKVNLNSSTNIGTIRLSVIDNAGLLSSGEKVDISIGGNTYSVTPGIDMEITLPHGEYDVSVTEPDNLVYIPSQNRINLTDEGAQVTVTVSKAQGMLKVSLTGEDPLQTVTVTVGDTSITLEYGKTESIKLDVGVYQLSVSDVEGYSLSFDSSSVSIHKGETSEAVLTASKIEPGKGSIVISLNTLDAESLPPKALINVFVNSDVRILNETNRSVTYTLEPGNYNVSFSPSGFDEYVLTGTEDKAITVEEGKTVYHEITVSDKGIMQINTTNLDPQSTFVLNILKDNKVVESISSENIDDNNLRLLFGSYTFACEYNGRNPGVILPEEASVTAGQNTSVTVDSLYNRGYGYVSAAIVTEVDGVTGFEVSVGENKLTSDNPDIWLPAGTYSVAVVSVLGLPEIYEAVNIEDITVLAKADTAVNIAFKLKPGSGDIDIDDNIAGDLEVSIEGLKSSYTQSDRLQAAANIDLPADSHAVYRWYIGNQLIGEGQTIDYSLQNTAEGKHSVSCSVYIGDAVYSARNEIRVKN